MLKALICSSLISLFAAFSMASGVCVSNGNNPGMGPLCAMQGQNPTMPKTSCTITTGCQWISNNDNGRCDSNGNNPDEQSLCQMQGQNGGYQACSMTIGCQWTDLDQ